MQILQLSETGFDRVTLWASPEKPEGCLIHYKGSPVVFAVASIIPGDQTEAKVGLFQMSIPLYNYLAEQLQGVELTEVDLDFISDWQQVHCVTLQGGTNRLPSSICDEMNALEARVHLDGFHEDVRAALLQQR